MSESRITWGAVVVAAGAGTRFGGCVPKQFTDLLGTSVIDHSLKLLADMVPHIAVVVPSGFSPSTWTSPPGIHLVTGGPRRQDSVLNGLRRVMEMGATHVLVHDGARPSVDRGTVSRVMESTARTGTGVPCIPVRDTVKMTAGGSVVGTVDRTGLQLAQTPQGFRSELLLEALLKAETVTDDSSAVEALGARVSVVEGSRRNIKLTDGEDRLILQRLMAPGETSIGTGLDFHPFHHDRPLIFCGCRLSEAGGLAGHSDGDVVLHAVADAILAASRAGDIGTLFPPDDMKWKDADSSELLAYCASEALNRGWKVIGLDVTVIGERPSVSRNREMFIDRLAGILGIPRESIWIKGTTTNTIGELAAGKGAGCHALATLARFE